MIYFDNSATTKPSETAVNAVMKGLSLYGNPSSAHKVGREAAHELKEARQVVAKALHTKADNIYFTSGGTMSDNIAVFGGAKKGVGNHIVTTAIEHHAVLNCFDELSKRGFDVSYIVPEKDGNIPIEKIEQALKSTTSFVSIMTVNNETGAIMPIEKVRAVIDRICPRAIFHTDAVQAFGKTELLPELLGIDMLSISAHKFHGPKGVGALYIRKGLSINQVLFGGGQEKNIHSGTENLAGIMGLAAAVSGFDYDSNTVININEYLRGEIKKFPYAQINSPENSSPFVLNVSFGVIPSEVILNALACEDICASAGSACANNRSGESYVLKAMGISPKSAVRFSFSKYNTMGEAKKCAEVLHKIIPTLNKVVGGN